MTGKKSAVIIGAGIGGIATAVYLAKSGYNVSVFEKNSSPGGRCGQLIRDGHRFDLGATMLIMPGIYREIFESLGVPLFEKNDINSLEDLYKIYFDNNDVIAFSTDKEKMKIQHEKIEPGSFAKSQKYVATGYEIFHIGINKLSGRNFDNIFQFANFRNVGMLIKLKTYISNYRYVKKFFLDSHLRMLFQEVLSSAVLLITSCKWAIFVRIISTVIIKIFTLSVAVRIPATEYQMFCCQPNSPRNEFSKINIFDNNRIIFMNSQRDTFLEKFYSIDFHKIIDHPNILIAANFWDDERFCAAKTCYKFMRAIDDMIDNHKAKNKLIEAHERKEFVANVDEWLKMIIISKECNPLIRSFWRQLKNSGFPYGQWKHLRNQ